MGKFGFSTVGKYAYRVASDVDDKMFYGAVTTKDEAVSQARKDYPGATVEVGKICHPMDLISTDIDWLVEQLECQFGDRVGGEHSGIHMTKVKRIELSTLIDNFFREHASFDCNGMTEVEEFPPS